MHTEAHTFFINSFNSFQISWIKISMITTIYATFYIYFNYIEVERIIH